MDPINYQTRLQKGGALLNDMRLLVRSWQEDYPDLRSASARSLLGKKTIARSRDTVVRAFGPRFLHGDPPQAWRLLRPLEDRQAEPEVLRPIYYWITARSECLLYDYVSQELVQVAGEGDGSVRIEETTAWIRNRLNEAGRSWSPTVTLKVARGLLAALRDFGILEGKVRKRIAPIHLPLQSFSYIAFCLSFLGNGGTALLNHPDWGLFLLTSMTVEGLFFQAHQQGYVEFHSAGGIVRTNFPVSTHEEYADVLLGTRP